jgi:glutaconate CoA-transferase subunit A
MCYVYVRDEAQIREWVQASKEIETTQAYLDKYIYGVSNHQEYLEMIGQEQLDNLNRMAKRETDERTTP